jgi:hypothetical protein
VSESVLEAAVARTIDGADRLVALLHDDKPPVKRTGAACRWCPVLADCAEGRAFLDDDDLDEPEGPAGHR